MSSPTATSPYDAIGGDATVRRLVDRFYDLMDTLPEAATVRAMHATSLASSRDKLHLFLTGWLGGPQVYVERYGHPRLRARHLPFAIGTAEAAAWMRCMAQALAEIVDDATVRDQLADALARLADHMRNQPG
ncbi:MAG: group II truncated hemoglobin [Kofleriaceae bacterium]